MRLLVLNLVVDAQMPFKEDLDTQG
jgi:hypothetical protein